MAENTTPTPDPTALLALARTQVAWRVGYSEEPPAYQEAYVQEQARQLAIYDSEIGRAAVQIGAQLDALIEQIKAFLKRWPDDGEAEIATEAAIVAAGLDPDPRLNSHLSFLPNFFSCDVPELSVWLPMLEMFRERVETLAPPDTATGKKQWDKQGRTAA